jgi:cytidyltransferase-like protein
MRILVMGLPGSGKTTLAKALSEKLDAVYLNADEVRKQYNDWDFSSEGRVRQAQRMSDLAWVAQDYEKIVVADFVCPTEETRRRYHADFTIFMDTIEAGRFEDTNRVFERPAHVDVLISQWGSVDEQVDAIIHRINMGIAFSHQKPTGLMIGRFQPFHDGHKKLFEKILEKQGQVLIMVRDTHGLDEKNPFDYPTILEGINNALQEYRNKYIVIHAPNICGVYYGRDVGYEVERIHLDAETESISATDIRKKMAQQ